MQSVSYVPTSLPEKSHVSSREWKGKLKNSSRDSSTLHEWWSLPEKENVGNQMTILLISKCEKFPLAVVSVNIYNWKVKAVEHVFQLASTYTIDTYCVYFYTDIFVYVLLFRKLNTYTAANKSYLYLWFCAELYPQKLVFFVKSQNMNFLLTSSPLFLFPILMLCTFIFIRHELFPKFIPQSIMSNYITPTASHLAWAWDFLLHYSLFPNSHKINVHENFDQGLNIGLYEPEEGSNEVVECAVCLCKIEEGEEVRELRCGHMFHRDCLDRWLGHRNGTCPLCRSCTAPSRMVNEVGEEVIVVKFSSSSPGNRSMWWLR